MNCDVFGRRNTTSQLGGMGNGNMGTYGMGGYGGGMNYNMSNAVNMQTSGTTSSTVISQSESVADNNRCRSVTGLISDRASVREQKLDEGERPYAVGYE